MASIEKRGNSYRIKVSNGYDSSGKKIVISSDSWTPPIGMTEKKIEKYLQTWKVEFENEIKSGKNMSSERLTFKRVAEQFLKDTIPGTEFGLARTTYKDYQTRLAIRIIPAIGHLKLGQRTNYGMLFRK